MTYHAISSLGLGATDIVAKCGEQIKSADLDTKAGREQSVTTGAECAADGYCASYGVPPGVCGPIAKSVAGEAIKLWNSIFGDDSAQRAERNRRIETAGYFAALNRIQDLDTQMDADLAASAKKLIDFHDRLMPTRKGVYGGGKSYAIPFKTWSKDYGEQSITVTGYDSDLPMRKALAQQGLLYETKWIAPAEKIQGQIYPPNLMARMMGASGIGGSWADEWAKARQAELQVACTKYPAGIGRTACLQQVPTLTKLKTQYAASLDGIVIQFYYTLSRAELLLRARIAAQAAKLKVEQQLKAKITVVKAKATAETGAAKLGAAAILAGAAVAALIIYKRRK